MELVKFDLAEKYEPGGHAGVVNRALVGRGSGGVQAMSVWYGEFTAGASSERHVHDQSVQVYVGLSGEFAVATDDEVVHLEVGDAVIIPAGEFHAIQNLGDTPANVLVISSPALR